MKNHHTNNKKEIILNRNLTIISKINSKGTFDYVNDYFLHITGYEILEILKEPQDIINCKDMPSLIVDKIKKELNETGKAFGIVKHSAKNGDFFWTIDYFEAKFNLIGEVDSYFVKRKFLSLSVKKEIESFYSKLRSIESYNNRQVAEKYFYGFLENTKKTYSEYILSLFQLNEVDILDYFNSPKESTENKIPENMELGIIERAIQ